MNMINIYDNQTHLNEGFTTFFLQLLNEKANLNICLSGGSTPKAVFDYWAENYNTKIPWNRIRFYWGDERCVAPTDEMSNYGMTRKHLLDKIDISDDNIFRIYGEQDPEKEAIRYGKILPVYFDLIILGMGDDGHTASIFPNEMQLWDSPANCVVATHPETGMKRVSITGKVINAAENVAFLVTGKTKVEKVNSILYHRPDVVQQYPAAKVFPLSGKLFWFLDFAAIGK